MPGQFLERFTVVVKSANTSSVSLRYQLRLQTYISKIIVLKGIFNYFSINLVVLSIKIKFQKL